jgi:hypothetical protein
MGEEERRAMAANALVCFSARYDMRENAKSVIRLFEAGRPNEAKDDHVIQ